MLVIPEKELDVNDDKGLKTAKALWTAAQDGIIIWDLVMFVSWHSHVDIRTHIVLVLREAK